MATVDQPRQPIDEEGGQPRDLRVLVDVSGYMAATKGIMIKLGLRKLYQ